MSHVSLSTKPADLDPTNKWIVGVAVLRRSSNEPSRVLICKRVAHEESFAGMWELPGGHIEAADANVQHTVARELYEETGLKLTSVIKRMCDMTWVGDSGKTSVQLNYEVTVENDENIRLCAEEHDDFMWASMENVEKVDMTSEMREVVLEALKTQNVLRS
ncbi:MAG: hypothetical protein Q9162_000212 [Coniocarpon cinnabarinum]